MRQPASWLSRWPADHHVIDWLSQQLEEECQATRWLANSRDNWLTDWHNCQNNYQPKSINCKFTTNCQVNQMSSHLSDCRDNWFTIETTHWPSRQHIDHWDYWLSGKTTVKSKWLADHQGWPDVVLTLCLALTKLYICWQFHPVTLYITR